MLFGHCFNQDINVLFLFFFYFLAVAVIGTLGHANTSPAIAWPRGLHVTLIACSGGARGIGRLHHPGVSAKPDRHHEHGPPPTPCQRGTLHAPRSRSFATVRSSWKHAPTCLAAQSPSPVPLPPPAPPTVSWTAGSARPCFPWCGKEATTWSWRWSSAGIPSFP